MRNAASRSASPPARGGFASPTPRRQRWRGRSSTAGATPPVHRRPTRLRASRRGTGQRSAARAPRRGGQLEVGDLDLFACLTTARRPDRPASPGQPSTNPGDGAPARPLLARSPAWPCSAARGGDRPRGGQAAAFAATGTGNGGRGVGRVAVLGCRRHGAGGSTAASAIRRARHALREYHPAKLSQPGLSGGAMGDAARAAPRPSAGYGQRRGLGRRRSTPLGRAALLLVVIASVLASPTVKVVRYAWQKPFSTPEGCLGWARSPRWCSSRRRSRGARRSCAAWPAPLGWRSSRAVAPLRQLLASLLIVASYVAAAVLHAHDRPRHATGAGRRAAPWVLLVMAIPLSVEAGASAKGLPRWCAGCRAGRRRRWWRRPASRAGSVPLSTLRVRSVLQRSSPMRDPPPGNAELPGGTGLEALRGQRTPSSTRAAKRPSMGEAVVLDNYGRYAAATRRQGPSRSRTPCSSFVRRTVVAAARRHPCWSKDLDKERRRTRRTGRA